ncbi:MAG: CoB--CoM heterodisulfide reductase iron-sulfur subunit B family protein [Spirochaetes bacterium]|nr:CoB--CoM heterodisulfide reductase iron-sulfur subunit B family protein [Spirochaetota bacterium]
MRIGYYPGCSLHGTAKEYDESLKAVTAAAGIELVELKDWNCCGATAAHSLNHELSIVLPARNLSIAEGMGLTEVLIPCAACYNRHLTAKHALTDEKTRDEASEMLKMQYKGSVRPVNIIDCLAMAQENIREKISAPFEHKVACYYGCLLVRPPRIMEYERFEDPTGMDDLMTLIGATPIEWPFKTDCCGAGLSVPRTDIVAKLSGKILESAQKKGAEAVIVACPMCHANLDMRRKSINAFYKMKFDIPVLYLTQAVGLALGIKEKILGIHRHMVKADLKKNRPMKPASAEKTASADTEV